MATTLNASPPRLKGMDFSKERIEACIRENRILKVSLAPSGRCNLKCPFCYADAGAKKRDEMKFRQISDIVEQAGDIGVKTVALVGGEPLIYPEIRELVSHISRLGMTPLIFTNGTVMTKDLAGFLFEHDASIIVKLNSLDDPGIQDGMAGGIEGTFRKINRTLSMLLEEGFSRSEPTRLGIESVICRSNLSQIPKIFRFARKSNIYPYLELVTPAGRGRHFPGLLSQEEAREIFHELLEIDEKEFGYTWVPRPPQVAAGCSYYFTSVYIGPDGKVQPCPGVPIVLGDLKKEKLSDILKKSETRRIRGIRGNIKGKCGSCKYRADCYGCRGAAFNITGDFFASYGMCWIEEDK